MTSDKDRETLGRLCRGEFGERWEEALRILTRAGVCVAELRISWAGWKALVLMELEGAGPSAA